MRLSYRINNGTVAVEYQYIQGAQASESAMVADLIDQAYPHTGLLPPVIRWYSRSRAWWLLEQPPRLVTIWYQGYDQIHAQEYQKAKPYTLPIPWTATLIRLDPTHQPADVYLFALEGPLADTSDRIGLLPLVNLGSSGRCCLPSSHDFVPPTIADGINAAVCLLWEGGFNVDLKGAFIHGWRHHTPAPLWQPFVDSPPVAKTSAFPARVYAHWEGLDLLTVSQWREWPRPAAGLGIILPGVAEVPMTIGDVFDWIETYETLVGANPTNLTGTFQGAYIRHLSQRI